MSFAGLERWITPEIREQSERFWSEVESMPEPEETIEEILDRNLYESLEDPGARLTRMLDRRQWQEAESEVREHTVSGRVVVLDLSGTFTVKPSSGAAKRIVHVEDPETLLGLRLQLGEWVHVRVHERHTTNRVGIESGVRCQLVGLDRPAGPDEDDLFS